MAATSKAGTGIPGIIKANYPDQGQIGYLVKAKRRDKNIHKMFYLHHYGGNWKKCLADAKKAAKRFFLENPRYSLEEVAQIVTKRNTSGVRGVRIKEKRYRWKSDATKFSVFLSAEAMWSPKKDKVKKRTFSLDKYGEEEAWRLACEAREKGLREMSRNAKSNR